MSEIPGLIKDLVFFGSGVTKVYHFMNIIIFCCYYNSNFNSFPVSNLNFHITISNIGLMDFCNRLGGVAVLSTTLSTIVTWLIPEIWKLIFFHVFFISIARCGTRSYSICIWNHHASTRWLASCRSCVKAGQRWMLWCWKKRRGAMNAMKRYFVEWQPSWMTC